MIDRSLNYGRQHIRRYLEQCAPYSVVLDLGAGPGSDLLIAKEISPQTEIHGVEVYEEYAQKLSDKGIRVHRSNIECDKLPFADNSVDVVIVNQILEHVKEVFWVFHEMTRVLKVGGRVIVGVPNIAAFHNRILMLAGRQPTQLKNASAHVRGYTKHDMLHFVNSCFPKGYDLENFKGSNFYPFPGPIAKVLSTIFPNMSWGIFLLFKKVRPYNSEFITFPTFMKLETNFYTGPK